ncbi:DUF6443 domain-containing protein [Taibaiella chishuiensis]|uniref:RHS repeat-associated protein n=1 Tax=Taibaiella chishuiensis TaxID=1434707 RepID=A0A2P8D7D2_9BACT|nr:DUF6443 domain-containing protein [Taibaiella chishuiensis]PSK93146.1 RHS repeat-associated protein [Taibaiella chishuiensis]
MKILNKYILLSLLVTIAFHNGFAQPNQNIPELGPPSFLPTATYPALRNLTNPGKHNYIQSIIPDQPLQNLPASGYKYRQQRDYFDGLGRPLQTNQRRAHADGFDIIQAYVYDSLGRERYQYLPFANRKDPFSTNGLLQLNVAANMRSFYEQAGSDEPPYSRTDFEASALGRPQKTLSPGRSWVDSGRGVSLLYAHNLNNEVRMWDIDQEIDALPETKRFYDPSTLYVTETTDEDGKKTREYKDRNGQVVLIKSQLVDGKIEPRMHVNYACTYYVYDKQNRLRYVIPPLAVWTIDNAGSWDVSQVPELCYQYDYDEKGRLAQKKIPGKAMEEYVYDERDRLIFSRDGNQKDKNKWAFTIYDGSDRPIVTGLIGFTSPRDVLQGLVDDPSVQYPAPDIWGYIKNYNLNNSYPVQINAANILSYTYYDNYGQLPGFSYDAAQFSGALASTAQPEIEQPVLSSVTRGLVTGSKVRVLDGENPTSNSQWLSTVNYYDNKNRLLQVQSQNLNGGLDISSNLYYFQGMPWRTILQHQNPRALAVPGSDSAIKQHRLVKTFTRNIAAGGGNDLVKKLEQQINGGAPFNISGYNYDHLNRVVVKDTRACMMLNEYNVRGFLNHIVVEDRGTPTFRTLFEERLSYDSGFRDKLYNGNIAGITWKGDDGITHAYGYTYDKLDRLTHAEHRHWTGSNWGNMEWDYTVSKITYDLNGNLRTMKQRGGKYPGPAQTIDELSYQYEARTNKLIKVEDGGVNLSGIPDFRNGANTAQEYDYDLNGNMVSDANKKLAIEYNDINKPEVMVVDGKGTIYYTYDAMGNLLRKKLDSSGVSHIYDNIGNFVYKDDVLQYILNEEGRCRPVSGDTLGNATRFVYDYFVKDHLGNVRSTVTSNPITVGYMAEHELATAGREQMLFDNIPNVRASKPGSTNPNDNMAAELDGAVASKRVGTAIMLKVMPGDKFEISTDSYYEGENQGAEETGAAPVINSLMNALMGGGTYAGVPVSELPENMKTISNILSNPTLPALMRGLQSNDNPIAPKAHLNYLFFDGQMQLVSDLSGSIQVQPNTNGWHNSGTVTIGPGVFGNSTLQPAYLIVYIDNQSIGKKVWFDNVHLEHYTSKVLEEDHYYPFGLTVGIDKAAQNNLPGQPYKYQGIQLERHYGLEMYETFYRGLDPQLGRFTQIDPKAEVDYHISPFTAMKNNPVLYTDPRGDVAGDYYGKDGKYLGKDEKNNDNKAYVTTEGNYNYMVNEGSKPDYDGLRANSTELPVSNSSLINSASTVYGESSFPYNVSKEDLKGEMFSLASVHANYPDEAAFGASNAGAVDFRSKSPDKRNGTKMQIAVEAQINASSGGPDYSNGARYWDGKDQALFPVSDNRLSAPEKGWQIHMNTRGWTITDEHYSKWKSNIGSSFKAPQTKFAPDGPNKGKITYQSTAVWGRTIFWKDTNIKKEK